jgi:hypothetical protein
MLCHLSSLLHKDAEVGWPRGDAGPVAYQSVTMVLSCGPLHLYWWMRVMAVEPRRSCRKEVVVSAKALPQCGVETQAAGVPKRAPSAVDARSSRS